MTDWKTYKSQTPFQFVVAPSESYNEGNKIAFSPKIPGKSPIWSMNMSGVAITPTHTPCRYWTGEGWEWKSWSERICMGLKIDYDSTLMFAEEQQILRVKDASGDIVDVDIVVWFLTGVGSIDAEIGSSITYTAPSVNITESDTAVIEMWCNGEVKDTLTISFAGKITYTTPQQPPDTDQVFNIDNPNPGCTYTWELTGGGSLSTYTGPTTTFTAPSTNPNCENNATIQLLCNGVVVDTLEIAINAVGAGDSAAYIVKTCVTEPYCVDVGESGCEPVYDWKTGCATCAGAWGQAYRCNGATFPRGWSAGPQTYPVTSGWLNYGPGYTTKTCESCIGYSCRGLYPGDQPSCIAADTNRGSTLNSLYGLEAGVFGTFDVRTEAQKAAGCCPAVLL